MYSVLYYVVLFTVMLLLSLSIHYIEKGVLSTGTNEVQRSLSKRRDERYYNIEDQGRMF